MPFTFRKTDIDGLVVVEPRVFPDDRGFFMEAYKESDFHKNGIKDVFKQDNHSFSTKGVIRGLHFQRSPMAQGKLVRVMKGVAWDVAVDLRKESATFKKWVGIGLSDANMLMYYIPPGFAHGFVALSDEVHLMYKCTEEYSPEHDAGIKWDDPDLGIEWPGNDFIVSEKDRDLPWLKDVISEL